MSSAPPAQWCLSRRGTAICTRALGHPGLHNRGGTALLWSDRQADPALCPLSGHPAHPAPTLADGFPAGRALCERCLAFVRVSEDGRLWNHDSFRGARTASEADQRSEWFNSFGWNG